MQAGEIVGARFVLEELAGRGGMGEVWRARDQRSGARVALKLMLAVGSDEAKRFLREADTMASLVHPSIVGFIAAGTESDAPWLAMEWVEGRSLESRLEEGPLPLDQAITVVKEAAAALDFAHGRGVVHRDVKPANLLLTSSAAGLGVKLIDFGIARAAGDGRGRLTRTGAVLGTPQYMAPEQARGAACDARTDVYALGCVLFQAITGVPPFDGPEIVAILAKTLFEDAPRVSTLAKVPEALDALVARMLAKPPDARPATCADVVRALASCDIPVTRAPAPPSESLGRVERRVAVALASGSLDSLASLAPTLDTTGQAPLHEEIRQVVAAHEGALELLAGGSLIALFSGAGPTDLLSRAARCALALRDLLPDIPFGIATGRAEQGGSAPVGDVLDAVVRLVSDADARRAAHVRLDATAASLLGSSFVLDSDWAGRPILAGARQAGAAPPMEGACVGRRRELAALEAMLGEVADESVCRVAVVTAAAGIGKSRLARELVGRAGALGFRTLFGRADPLAADAPFALLAQLLRGAIGARSGETRESLHPKLRAELGVSLTGARVEQACAYLEELLGATQTPMEPTPSARRDVSLTGDLIQRSVADWLDASTRAKPTLLVLDDVQWADRTTLQLVDHALRTLGDRRIGVVALGRPELHERFPKLFLERDRTEMRLSSLSRSAALELARARAGPSASDEAIERIVQRADGNAFFLEELARATREGSSDALPATVLGTLEARLDALPAESRRVLRAASVFGMSFWVDGLDTLLGGRTGREVRERISELFATEWLEPRPSSRLSGQTELAFRHALVREAAYATLTPRDREVGHRLAAEWLVRAGENDARVVAEHFARSDRKAVAPEWFARAAERALAGHDFESAIDAAERSLAAGVGDRGYLLFLQAEAWRWRGEYEKAIDAATTALGLLAVGSEPWFECMGALFLARGYLGQHDRIPRELTDALAAMPTPTARAAQAICLCRGGWQLLQGARYDEVDRVIAHVEALDRAEPLTPLALAWLAWIRSTRAQHRGDHAAYVAGREVALARFVEGGDERNAANLEMSLGYAHAQAGDYARAEALLRSALATGERLGVPMTICYALHNLGYVLLRVGRTLEARAAEERAIEIARTLRHARLEGGSRLYLALVHLAEGDPPRAEKEAVAARELLATSKPLLPLAIGIEARALLARGEGVRAWVAARDAMAMLDSMGGTDEGDALVRLVYVESLLAVGREPEARVVLRAARARLLERSRRLPGEDAQAQWLHSVPDHRVTLELASKYLDDKRTEA